MKKCLGHDLGLVSQPARNLIYPIYSMSTTWLATSPQFQASVSSEFGVNLFSHLTLSQSSSLPTRTPSSCFLLQLIGHQVFIERGYSIQYTRGFLYTACQFPFPPSEGTTGMCNLGWIIFVNTGDLNPSPYICTVSTATYWAIFPVSSSLCSACIC